MGSKVFKIATDGFVAFLGAFIGQVLTFDVILHTSLAQWELAANAGIFAVVNFVYQYVRPGNANYGVNSGASANSAVEPPSPSEPLN